METRGESCLGDLLFQDIIGAGIFSVYLKSCSRLENTDIQFLIMQSTLLLYSVNDSNCIHRKDTLEKVWLQTCGILFFFLALWNQREWQCSTILFLLVPNLQKFWSYRAEKGGNGEVERRGGLYFTAFRTINGKEMVKIKVQYFLYLNILKWKNLLILIFHIKKLFI